MQWDLHLPSLKHSKIWSLRAKHISTAVTTQAWAQPKGTQTRLVTQMWGKEQLPGTQNVQRALSVSREQFLRQSYQSCNPPHFEICSEFLCCSKGWFLTDTNVSVELHRYKKPSGNLGRGVCICLTHYLVVAYDHLEHDCAASKASVHPLPAAAWAGSSWLP